MMRTPSFSSSQRIGQFGLRVFQGNHPDSWIAEGTPEQGGDFGFDGTMWLESLGKIQGRFSIQLKAGANVKWAGGDAPFLSVGLRVETCNLYVQDGHPVLLVFIALADEARSDDASMYYIWIEEELRARLGAQLAFDESFPDEMSFRIPASNRLTRQLDITSHVQRHWDHNRLGKV